MKQNLEMNNKSRRATLFANAIRCCMLLVLLFGGAGMAATITVTNNGDNYANPAAGSLRRAIADAKNGDKIIFAQAFSIQLDTTLSIAGKSIEIDGLVGANKVTINGDWDGTETDTLGFGALSIITIAGQKITLSNCIVQNGNAQKGGGIFAQTEGNLDTIRITNCRVQKNNAGLLGGGICAYGNVFVNNCTLVENKANNHKDGGGGGIYLNGGQINHCTINRNSAFQFGAAAYINAGLIINSTIVANSTPTSAAIDINNHLSSYLAVEFKVFNCVIMRNYGHGIVTDSKLSNKYIVVAHCTILNNTNSGYINFRNSSWFYNSIVSNDQDRKYWGSDYINCAYTRLHRGQVCFDDNQFMTAPDAGKDLRWGTDDDVFDLRLKPNSACINNGYDSVFCQTDFDGKPRKQSVRPDIGAFESAGTNAPMKRYSAITVTNNSTDYDQANSLAWALIHADDQCLITFDADYSISLPCVINDFACKLTIDGGTHKIVLDGGISRADTIDILNDVSMFQMNESNNFSLQNITLQNTLFGIDAPFINKEGGDYGMRLYNVHFKHIFETTAFVNAYLQNCTFEDYFSGEGGLPIAEFKGSNLEGCTFNNITTKGWGIHFTGCEVKSSLFENLSCAIAEPAVSRYSKFHNCTFRNLEDNSNRIVKYAAIRTISSQFINCIMYNANPVSNFIRCDSLTSQFFRCAFNLGFGSIPQENQNNITLTSSPFASATSSALAVGNVCVDAGVERVITAAQDTIIVPTANGDVEGKVRLQNKKIDIGAFEEGAAKTVNVTFSITSGGKPVGNILFNCNGKQISAHLGGIANYINHPAGKGLTWKIDLLRYEINSGSVAAITKDTTINIELKMKELHTLVFKVLYDDLPFAFSELTANGTVMKNMSGVYTLPNLPIGVAFKYDVSLTRYYSSVLLASQSGSVTMTSTDTVFLLKFYSPRLTATFVVVDQQNQPLANAVVNDYTQTATTNAQGEAVIGNILENTTMQYNITCKGYKTYSNQLTVQSNKRITIVMEKSDLCNVFIQVLDKDLKPMANAQILFDNQYYYTNLAGKVVIPDVVRATQYSCTITSFEGAIQNIMVDCSSYEAHATVCFTTKYIVSNDSGKENVPFSFLWCIKHAQSGDTILFDNAYHIYPEAAFIISGKGMYINGATPAGNVTIDGGWDGTSSDASYNSIASINNYMLAPMIIENMHFVNGKSTIGSVFYISNKAPGNVLRNCTFEQMLSTTKATIDIRVSGEMMIENSSFSQITALGTIGAISLNNTGNTSIYNCSFTDNTSPMGGGLQVLINRKGLYLNRCHFENNTSSGVGGGISITQTTDRSYIANCIFNDNNAASYGGAVYIRSEQLASATFIGNNTMIRNTSATNLGSAIYQASAGSFGFIKIVNTVFWGSSKYINDNGNGSFIVEHCASDEALVDDPQTLIINAINNANNGPQFYDTVRGNTSLQWTPQAQSVLVDAGKADTTRMLIGNLDFSGNNRAINTMDIGAIEQNTDFAVQRIVLHQGWNLISTNVCPKDSAIATLFKNSDVQEIKTMNTFWRKRQIDAFNSLKYLSAGQGYLVFMNKANTLTLMGNKLKTSTTIVPQTSWQLIGCQYQTATLFSSIFSVNTLTIKNFDGFWLSNGSKNSIDSFEPSKGYFIRKQ